MIMAKTDLDKFLESANEAFKEAYKIVTPDMLPRFVRHSFTEEEERRVAEEQRRAADIERTAQRTTSLVLGALAARLLEPAAPEPPPQQLPKPEQATSDDTADDGPNLTVDEFCERNGISRSTLYKEWRTGGGPKRVKTGKTTRITRRAERLWRREREAASHGKGS
jgi:predicted DNA-binding transcriptional regulator AlpA